MGIKNTRKISRIKKRGIKARTTRTKAKPRTTKAKARTTKAKARRTKSKPRTTKSKKRKTKKMKGGTWYRMNVQSDIGPRILYADITEHDEDGGMVSYEYKKKQHDVPDGHTADQIYEIYFGGHVGFINAVKNDLKGEYTVLDENNKPYPAIPSMPSMPGTPKGGPSNPSYRERGNVYPGSATPPKRA